MAKPSRASAPAPAAPTRGLTFRLEPSNGAYWVNLSIAQVNRRSFYASVDGVRERHLLAEWIPWLRDLCARGTLIHNGKSVHVAGFGPSATFTPVAESRALLHGRMRSARRVVKTYSITQQTCADERWFFEVAGGARAYTVRAHPEWSEPPSCDCPDATGRRSPWCKHSLAVLMSEPALRCQLLDIMLEIS